TVSMSVILPRNMVVDKYVYVVYNEILQFNNKSEEALMIGVLVGAPIVLVAVALWWRHERKAPRFFCPKCKQEAPFWRSTLESGVRICIFCALSHD
ncbi:MAG: hypothetical protein NUV61_02335, partial [Candidatus Azambacteria bacterium]|nr:hypothetical protein [Candidatus Azambacteria bacterium]